MSRIVRGVALYKIMLLCIWNFRGNSWAVSMQKLYDCVASHQKSNEFRDHDEIIRWNSWVFRGSRFWHMHHQTTSHKQGCVASCTWHQLISISRELRVVVGAASPGFFMTTLQFLQACKNFSLKNFLICSWLEPGFLNFPVNSAWISCFLLNLRLKQGIS